MKQVEDMPEVGQFIAVWEFDNTPWSCTLRIIGDLDDHFVECYNSQIDDWEKEHKNVYKRIEAKFYVLGDQ